jgi:nicotinate-nucleotide pyrophosphorylase (carboxylating)
VECDTLEQVDEALGAGADVLLLDNMDLKMMTDAVKRTAGKAVTEASGGVTLSNVLAIAKTGVDIISTSQITLSAPAVDIGLDFL